MFFSGDVYLQRVCVHILSSIGTVLYCTWVVFIRAHTITKWVAMCTCSDRILPPCLTLFSNVLCLMNMTLTLFSLSVRLSSGLAVLGRAVRWCWSLGLGGEAVAGGVEVVPGHARGPQGAK